MTDKVPHGAGAGASSGRGGVGGSSASKTLSPIEYILANPDHEVRICKNVIASKDDRRLRVTFELRQGPYRPRTLGIYVVASWEDALELRAHAKTAFDDTNISEKGNPLNGQ